MDEEMKTHEKNGISQTYKIDYDERFVPVAKMDTFLTAYSKWGMHWFLHGDLEEEV
ncbi:retrotransposon protein putative unclassified, partial [Trifolium medium]|nr:retrotransposon protein putative unclassified [Trifolium medium]